MNQKKRLTKTAAVKKLTSGNPITPMSASQFSKHYVMGRPRIAEAVKQKSRGELDGEIFSVLGKIKVPKGFRNKKERAKMRKRLFDLRYGKIEEFAKERLRLKDEFLNQFNDDIWFAPYSPVSHARLMRAIPEGLRDANGRAVRDVALGNYAELSAISKELVYGTETKPAVIRHSHSTKAKDFWKLLNKTHDLIVDSIVDDRMKEVFGSIINVNPYEARELKGKPGFPSRKKRELFVSLHSKGRFNITTTQRMLNPIIRGVKMAITAPKILGRPALADRIASKSEEWAYAKLMGELGKVNIPKGTSKEKRKEISKRKQKEFRAIAAEIQKTAPVVWKKARAIT